ncbi:MAG: hypothetical protein JJ863_04350 [Deltaproteobacteria bacterium]|nr:hypothetical protein [Deltaproteobacteria bacterium]
MVEEEQELRPGLFPLPVWIDGEDYNGLTVRRHPACADCSHQECLGLQEDFVELGRPQLCREALVYCWLTDVMLARGFVIKEYKPSPRTQKRLRKQYRRRVRERASLIDQKSFESYARAAQRSMDLLSSRQMKRSEEVARAQIDEGEIARKVSAALEGNAKSASRAVTHDLMQLLSTIFQSIEYVLAARYGDQAADKSLPAPRRLSPADREDVWNREKAILITCNIMQMRLKANDLIRDPDAAIELHHANPHQIFYKTRELLHAKARRRALRFRLQDWWTNAPLPKDQVVADIVAFALLDNAVKYSPDGGRVAVEFDRPDGFTRCRVRSLGPKILDSEKVRIFEMDGRGRYAAQSKVPGSGLGLWMARIACSGWAKIDVAQDPDPARRITDRYETLFTLTLTG